MLDTKTAYGTETPKSPGACQGSALVHLTNGEVVEMHIYAKWYEGKRTRYNLVQFGPNNMLKHVLLGWNGDLVEVLQ
jgi:hypothetical protein